MQSSGFNEWSHWTVKSSLRYSLVVIGWMTYCRCVSLYRQIQGMTSVSHLLLWLLNTSLFCLELWCHLLLICILRPIYRDIIVFLCHLFLWLFFTLTHVFVCIDFHCLSLNHSFEGRFPGVSHSENGFTVNFVDRIDVISIDCIKPACLLCDSNVCTHSKHPVHPPPQLFEGSSLWNILISYLYHLLTVNMPLFTWCSCQLTLMDYKYVWAE